MILFSITFHRLIFRLATKPIRVRHEINVEYKKTSFFAGTLTVIIGIVLIYMEPLMLAVDMLGFLFNQKNLINLLDRMQRIDDKLLKESITLDNRFSPYKLDLKKTLVTIYEPFI